MEILHISTQRRNLKSFQAFFKMRKENIRRMSIIIVGPLYYAELSLLAEKCHNFSQEFTNAKGRKQTVAGRTFLL